jgi:hypothetical protein
MHGACFAAFWVGVSRVALAAAGSLYLLRMLAITGFYHRYFSHRAFQTSRIGQFVFGFLGASAVQRGPIWWAAHHRHHHAHADLPEDVHSPVQHGFLWSHMGWFMCREHFMADMSPRHSRRGLAQQSSSLSSGCPPGILLVGIRPDVLFSQMPRTQRRDLGPAARARRCTRRRRRSSAINEADQLAFRLRPAASGGTCPAYRTSSPDTRAAAG